MNTPSWPVRALCGLSAVLALSHCATTRESVQECKKASYDFCERTVRRPDSNATPAAQAAGREAFQACLDTQLQTCGPR